MSFMGDTCTYLAIPFCHNRRQTPLFKTFFSKLSSWSKNHLSKVGHLTTIQVVLQPLPLHLMSCIKSQNTYAFYWRKESGNSIGLPINLQTKFTGLTGTLFVKGNLMEVWD